jgi:hypothetical protein
MKMLSRSERVYSCGGSNIYCFEGLCAFFQSDQNQVIRDGDEAAEIHVWWGHGKQMPVISFGLTLEKVQRARSLKGIQDTAMRQAQN